MSHVPRPPNETKISFEQSCVTPPNELIELLQYSLHQKWLILQTAITLVTYSILLLATLGPAIQY